MSSSSEAGERHLSRALALYQTGRIEEAAAAFEEAHASFEESGAKLRAAEAANNLSVAFLQLGRAAEALAALEGTAQVFLDEDDRQRAAEAYGNTAAALEATGDWRSAADTYQRAIDLFSEIGEEEAKSYTLQALSQLQLKHGQAMQAVSSMQASLDARPRRGLKERLMSRLLKLPFRLLGR